MRILFHFGFLALGLMGTLCFADSNQDLLAKIAGNYHSTNGYIATVVNGTLSIQSGTSCQTTEPLSFSLSGGETGYLTYSFQCSNGYQGQEQSEDFNPGAGNYQNGYNTISSYFLNDGSGIERDQMTTWGFGSMVNYQHQNVILKVPGENSTGPKTLSFELRNDQTNVSNDSVTVYHLDLVQE